MKKQLGIGTAIAAVVLLAIWALLQWELPLPRWVWGQIDKRLSALSLQVGYGKAYADLLGNIRLEAVSGRYKGLVDFSARQVLIRAWAAGGVRVSVEGGVVHTGFLQLPIPETIEFSGVLQQRRQGLRLDNVRLKAQSLVVLLDGVVRLPQEVSADGATASARGSAFAWPREGVDGLSATQKAIADSLAQLCRSESLWVAQVDLRPQKTRLTLSGSQLVYRDYTIDLPVVSLDYPLSSLTFGASQIRTPYGTLYETLGCFRADEGALWRLIVRRADIVARKDTLRVGTIAASTRWPIAALGDMGAATNTQATVDLSARCRATADNITLQPLYARVYGMVPTSVTSAFGLQLASDRPFALQGEWREGRFYFSAMGGRGAIYQLPFQWLQARGSINTQGTQLSFGGMLSTGPASGTLQFDFKKSIADYTVIGYANPMVLPWFGPEWAEIFAPLGPEFTPTSLLTVNMAKARPPLVRGVATSAGHSYKALKIDNATTTFYIKDQQTTLRTHITHKDESATATMSWTPTFDAKLTGTMHPATLASMYLQPVPEALKNLTYSQLPTITATAHDLDYTVTATTPAPVSFYALELDNLSATATGGPSGVKLDPVSFGYTGGTGTATAQINTEGVGYGSFSLRNAALAEKSLLGPLSQMLKTKWLSFATLRLESADGAFSFTPTRVSVEQVNMWGREHAATAQGSIDTVAQTVDFTVKLKTLGGSNPTFGLLGPIVRPFTSVLESRVTGPIAQPEWKLQLTTPSL